MWRSFTIGLNDVSCRKITPHLLFREGFKVAGDDLLLDIIQRCVLLPANGVATGRRYGCAAALLATLLAIRDELILEPFCASKRRF